MKKKIIGKDIPLLFACSGGSDAAELVEIVARKLAVDNYVYMSCPPAVSARIDKVLKKLVKDEKVIVLDGCESDCVAETLRNSGFNGFLHIRLNDAGITKDKIIKEKGQAEMLYNYILKKINDRKTWDDHKFSYSKENDKFK